MDTNATIFQQGYVTDRQLLDPFNMRPWLNKAGETMVTYLAGYQTVKNEAGKTIRQPVFKNKRVFKNALLRQADWEQIDTAVVDVMRQPLVGLSDLEAAGLTQPLDGLGVSLSTYDQISDMSPASVNMSITPHKAEKDRPVFTPVSVPIPVITKPFTLDIRTLDASRRNGHEGLDVTGIRVATIKVREAIEEIIFNGSDVQIGAYKIYGYTNHPERLADTAGNFGGGDWGTDGNAHKTISGMIAGLIARGASGPFGLYVASTQYAQSLNLTGTNLSDTQLTVIQRTIPDLKFVRRAPKLAAGTGVLVSMTKETVDIAIGQNVTPISWQEYGGLMNEFMVLAAMAPRFRHDLDGNLGVAHVTGI